MSREAVLTYERENHRIRRAGACLFAFYVLALLYFLFFSEGYGRMDWADRSYRYNLVPFAEIRRFWIYREELGRLALFTNLAGNVAGFLPFGFILPIICRGMRSGYLISLAGLGLSLCVETIQLVTRVGCFDVDDLILNTLGAAAGYLAFVFCYYLRRVYYGKKI